MVLLMDVSVGNIENLALHRGFHGGVGVGMLQCILRDSVHTALKV